MEEKLVSPEDATAIVMLQEMFHGALLDESSTIEYVGILFVGMVGAISAMHPANDSARCALTFAAFADYARRIKDKFPALEISKGH